VSAADMLESALAGLGWTGRDPEQVRMADPVRRFGTILRHGCDTWAEVAKAVGSGSDFKRAAELLETRPTFEAHAGNPSTFEFEKDIRLAVDSRAFTGGTAEDAFILAVAPVRRALFEAETVAGAAIIGVTSAAHELASLPGEAEALRARADSAWTRWGRRRLHRRAERLDARAMDLAGSRKQRARNARATVSAMAADAQRSLRIFEAWLSGDQREESTT